MTKRQPPGGPPKDPSHGDPHELRQTPFASIAGVFQSKKDRAHGAAIEAVHLEERTRIAKEKRDERDRERPADRQAAEERLRLGPTLDVRFTAALKSNFRQYPPKSYETLLPGLKLMGVRPNFNGTELYVNLIPENNPPVTKDYPGYVSLIVNNAGELKGKIPDELKTEGLSMDLIKDELIHRAEEMRIGFWIFKTVDGVAGMGDPREFSGDSSERNEISREEVERLKFLNKIDDAIFGAMVSSTKGFDDYNAIFLAQGVAVFDNKQVGNAVYIIRDLPPISKPVLSEAEKNKYFDEHVKPLIQGGKQLARQLGAIRIPHQGDNWKDTILANI